MTHEADKPSRIIIAGLDIETTGLNQADGHAIIEIALSLYELTSGTKVGSFASRINPQRPIDPGAQEVHGISFEMLAHEPLWSAVAPRVSAILAKCHHVVAHNGDGFDMPFVYAELARAGHALPTHLGLVDTMLQARWATPDGSVPNLGALCFASGVPYDPSKAHGALYDVDVMMDCFLKYQPRGFFQLPSAPWKFTPPKPKAKKEKP